MCRRNAQSARRRRRGRSVGGDRATGRRDRGRCSCCGHLRRCRLRVPVRVKNTSSRLGRCRDSSVDARCRRRAGAGRRRGSAASSLDPARVSRSRPSRPGWRRRSRRAAGRASSSCAGSDGRTDESLAADHALEPVRGVVGDHAAVVDDGDLVGEGVGLLEVLRGEQHGRALVDEARGRRPTCPRAWPGRGRWSARPGRSPPGGRPGWRPGRAAGACRRSRSWPAGRRRR